MALASFPKKLFWLLAYLASIAAVVIGCYFVVVSIRSDRAKNWDSEWTAALPDVLGVEHIVTAGSSYLSGPISAPLRGSCGGAVFQLTETAAKTLIAEGAGSLDNARQGRGFPEQHEQFERYSYSEWAKTPVPENWIGDGPLGGMMRCGGLAHGEIGQVLGPAKEAGGYYAESPAGRLIVLPEKKIAIYGYFHN